MVPARAKTDYKNSWYQDEYLRYHAGDVIAVIADADWDGEQADHPLGVHVDKSRRVPGQFLISLDNFETISSKEAHAIAKFEVLE